MPDQRETIQAALRDFTDRPLAETARAFLDTLGYRSDRTLDLGDSSPGTFLDYVRSHAPNSRFDETKALFADWKSADLLFQLTDEELASTSSLFHETDIQPGLLRPPHHLLRRGLPPGPEQTPPRPLHPGYSTGEFPAVRRKQDRLIRAVCSGPDIP